MSNDINLLWVLREYVSVLNILPQTDQYEVHDSLRQHVDLV